jgi:hypothetical protein
MQIGKAARSNGSHIKSRLKMEPHGVFKEVTKQCTNKDHYQSSEEDEHVDDDELRETMSCILKKHRRQNSQACVPNNGLSFTFRCPACVFCFAC